MKNTHTDTVVRASEDETRPDTDALTAGVYELKKRRRGRPRREDPGEGQINVLDGRQVRYLESDWNVEPEPLDEDDDLAAIVEAGIEDLALNEITGDTPEQRMAAKAERKGHWFSKYLTVGVGLHLAGEPGSVLQALTGHL